MNHVVKFQGKIESGHLVVLCARKAMDDLVRIGDDDSEEVSIIIILEIQQGSSQC